MNSTKHKCPHCEEEYSIKWENEDLEPTTCPFCGGDASIDEDDAEFLNNEEEQDDWNLL
jgi:Zn ribbon nucleic-acid-binding protein